MRPLREAPEDPLAAFERASQAAGQARRAMRAALPLDRVAADLGVCGLIAGGAMLVRGDLPPRRALMGGLGAAFGLDVALARLSPGTTPEQLVEVRDARLAAGRSAAGLRPPLANGLILVERLADASPAVRDLLFDVAAGGGPPGWRRPEPFALLLTEPALALRPDEADRLLARIDLKNAATGSLERAIDPDALAHARWLCAQLPVGERVLAAALGVVRRARPDDPEAPPALAETAASGPGPRAGRALLQLIRARALCDGRLTPTLDDVRAMALPVIEPRLRWREGADGRAALNALAATIPD